MTFFNAHDENVKIFDVFLDIFGVICYNVGNIFEGGVTMCFYFLLSEAELMIIPDVRGRILLKVDYFDGFSDDFYLSLKQLKQSLFRDKGGYF